MAQIKIFFLQKWFLIGSSIRFQTGVTFEEKLYIITEVYLGINPSLESGVRRYTCGLGGVLDQESSLTLRHVCGHVKHATCIPVIPYERP